VTDLSPATAAAAATFPGWLAARTRTTYAERAGRFLGWLDVDADLPSEQHE